MLPVESFIDTGLATNTDSTLSLSFSFSHTLCPFLSLFPAVLICLSPSCHFTLLSISLSIFPIALSLSLSLSSPPTPSLSLTFTHIHSLIVSLTLPSRSLPPSLFPLSRFSSPTPAAQRHTQSHTHTLSLASAATAASESVHSSFILPERATHTSARTVSCA